MLETFRNAWRIPELRKKLLYTILILLLLRFGLHVPVPFMTSGALTSLLSDNNNFLNIMNMFSGGALENSALFSLTVMPYINASIIMQLLTIAIPALERMQKEGEDGRRRINQITRYVTVGIGALLAYGYYALLRSQGAITYTSGFSGIFSAIVIIASFVAGSSLVVWMGEQIDSKGIGNGISLIIFANILSGLPGTMFNAFAPAWQFAQQGATRYYFFMALIIIALLALMVLIVFMSSAERRIPVQYSKKVVGRKMYGGQSTHIPIKVNMSGVMPVIFAQSIVSIPGTIASFVKYEQGSMADGFFKLFSFTSPVYIILFFLLIIAFNYFYVSTQYNPVEIANNLRKNNGGVPGIRPGKPTSDYIQKILSKVVLLGALFLGLVAILPIVLGMATGISLALGGTSLIILVGVALDTVRSIESQMMMRHYKGFLE